jgi:predicted DNA-binding transcriptional regulator AlpA
MQQRNETYLNEQEAASFTRFSVGTLRNMRSAKRGPGYLKVSGKTVRYRQRDLEAWMNGQPVLTCDSLPEK